MTVQVNQKVSTSIYFFLINHFKQLKPILHLKKLCVLIFAEGKLKNTQPNDENNRVSKIEFVHA